VTLSVGTAFCPEDGYDVEALLAEADRRMYAVKQTHHAQAAADLNTLAQGASGE
jgi:GGDEF domain-containing protein